MSSNNVQQLTDAANVTDSERRDAARSVVVPVYDEYPGLWHSLVERLLERQWDEVVVCLDEPDSETLASARRYEDDSRVVLSVSEARRGKGGALIEGFGETTGDVVGFVDADGAVSVRELECLFNLVEQDDADVAIGSRGLSNERQSSQSVVRRIFAAGYSMLARRATDAPVQDFQCGAKAFTREAWETVADDIGQQGFAFDTALLAQLHHAGFNIREVSIDWNDPGDSDVSLTSDVPQMLSALRSIRQSCRDAGTTRPDGTATRLGLVSCHPPDRGHLAEYCEALASEYGTREDVDLTVLSRRSDYAPSVEYRGEYAVRRLWDRDSFRGSVALLRELLTGGYDVIHFNVHMTYFGTTNRYRFLGLLLPPLLSRLVDAKVVTTLHDLLEVVEDEVIEEEIGVLEVLGAVLGTQMVLLGDATTVTSDEYLDVIESRYQATDVHHVPHGTFRTGEGSRPTFESPLRVLVFGHLGPTKDVETVIEAIERVQESVPDAELWVAGDSHPGYPGYREKLEKQFATTPGVRFTGYVEEFEMDELWESASMVVMPYHTCTGVSGVFQLAKSYGKPVVAYDSEGMRTSTVETGGEAAFVTPGYPDGLADEIVELWEDRDRLAEMAQANAAASSEFTITDTAERLLDIFGDDEDATVPATERGALEEGTHHPCPQPDCDGTLDGARGGDGDPDAGVCDECETPAVRSAGGS